MVGFNRLRDVRDSESKVTPHAHVNKMYEDELQKLTEACRQHPSSQSAALFADLARAAGKDETLCSTSLRP